MPQYLGNFMRFGWDPAENGWGDPMNLNLVTLDTFINRVATVQSSAPASPSPGQVVIVDQDGASGAFLGQEGKLAYWNVESSSWEFASVPVGWVIGDADATKEYLFTAVDTYVEKPYDTSGLAPNNTVKNYFIQGVDQFGRNPNEQLKFAFEDQSVLSKNIFLLENAVYQMANTGTEDLLVIHGDITIAPSSNSWATVPSGDFDMRVLNTGGAGAYEFTDFSQSATFQVIGTNDGVDSDTPMRFIRLNSNRVFSSLVGGATIIAEYLDGLASGPDVFETTWYNQRGLQQVTEWGSITDIAMTAPGMTLSEGVFGPFSPQLFFGTTQSAYFIHTDDVNTSLYSDSLWGTAGIDLAHPINQGSVVAFTSFNNQTGGVSSSIDLQSGDDINKAKVRIMPGNGGVIPAAGVEYIFEDIPQSGDNPQKVLGYNPSTGIVEAFNPSTGGTDELVKISATDANAGYLEDKIQAGSNINITKLVTSGDECLKISSPSTTAGILDTFFLTGDSLTTTAGTFYETSNTGKGSVALVTQTVTNNDNQKTFYGQDYLSIVVAGVPRKLKAGPYNGSLKVQVNSNSADQRWGCEIYLTDGQGVPEASGVTGQPIGDLGVQIVAEIDSGIIDVPANNPTAVTLSGVLPEDFSVPVGKRLRLHYYGEKIGAAGANINFDMFSGQDANSFINVASALLADDVEYDNTISGLLADNVQDAIDEISGTIDTQDLQAVTDNGFETDNPIYIKRNPTGLAGGFLVERLDNGLGLGMSVTAADGAVLSGLSASTSSPITIKAADSSGAEQDSAKFHDNYVEVFNRLLVGGAVDNLVDALQVDGSTELDGTVVVNSQTTLNGLLDLKGNGLRLATTPANIGWSFGPYPTYLREENGVLRSYELTSSSGGDFQFHIHNTGAGDFNVLVDGELEVTNGIETPKLLNVPTGSIAYTYGQNSSGDLVKSGQVLSFTNPATLTPDASTTKQINANAQAQALTINVPTNPIDGAKVIYRIRAISTSTLTWSGSFVDLTGNLPTSASINKTILVGVIYHGFTSSWEVVSVVEQP